MEFLQNSLRVVWEPLLQVPMPWRMLLVLMVSIVIMSWLSLRGFPWLFKTLSQLGLTLANFIANILLLPDNWISHKFRQNGKNPPAFLYWFGSLLSGIVGAAYQIKINAEKLSVIAQNKKHWLPNKQTFFLVLFLFLMAAIIRPFLGETAVAKSIDSGMDWWDSLEEWILTGRWGNIARISPEQFTRNYFLALAQNQFESAYQSLSPRFIKEKTQTYQAYLDWWDRQLDNIQVNQVSLISQNRYSALVNVQFQYLYKETQEVQSMELNLGLIWDFQNRKWLIDKSKFIQAKSQN
jgi:hypothetical protein